MDLLVLDPTQDPIEDNLEQIPIRHHPVHKVHCFHKEVDEDGVCWLTFDTPESPANVWNADTLDEFDGHIEEIHRDHSIRALIIRSAKDRVFVAGADLKTVQHSSGDQLNELLALGQDVFGHLESLRIPKVAAIHGACLGGGFELTLACDWRIATDDESTKLGLPEVMLGLIPAWGGCTRLSRLIGLPKALDLILRGKTLKAAAAKHFGLIHHVVAPENLGALARQVALQPTSVKHHHFHFTQIWPTPQLLRLKAKTALRAKFPWMRTLASAPMMAVDVITRGASTTFEKSLILEQKAIRQLAGSAMTRRLIEVFFEREQAAKKLPTVLAKQPARKIANAAVIGAGVMGSGIGYTLASRGSKVLITDVSVEALAKGYGNIQKLLASGIKHHALSATQARDLGDRIALTHERVPMTHMDLIIEAVVEDMEVKKALLADLAMRCGVQTILATNTSALSVTEMAKDVPNPERVLGLHFFNPAHLMPLVEVIVHDRTSPEVTASAMRFLQGIGKVPVLVQDSPGFVVNRILMPYMMEAVRLSELMKDPWELDDAMTAFGMPMGPLRLLDEVGFDIALHVERTMRNAFGDRLPRASLLSKMAAAGMLGKKNGKGFYLYDEHASGRQPNRDILVMLKPRETPLFGDHETMAEHLNAIMRAEALFCLSEKVAATAQDIQLAMILGAGYPPFRRLFSPTSTRPLGEVHEKHA